MPPALFCQWGQPLVPVLLECWASLLFILSGGPSSGLTSFPHTLMLISDLWNTPAGSSGYSGFFLLLTSLQFSTLPTLANGLSNPSPEHRELAELHLNSPSCSVAWKFSQGLTLFVSHLLAFLFHLIEFVCLSEAGDKSSPYYSILARSRKPVHWHLNKQTNKLCQNKIPRK